MALLACSAALLVGGCGVVVEPVERTEAESRPGERSTPAAPSPLPEPEPVRPEPAPPLPTTPAPIQPLPDPPRPPGIPSERTDAVFLGRTVYGLHPEMAARLRRAEALFLSRMADEPPETRQVESIAGYRTGSRGHSTGLAVDINYWRNPYIMHEKGEGELDRQLAPVYHRIARLMLGRDSVIPEEITQGGIGPTRTMALFEQLDEESLAMVRYFQLMQQPEALRRHLETATSPLSPAYWDELLPDGSTPTAESMRRQMAADYAVLSGREGPRVPGLEYPLPPFAAGDRPFAGDPAFRAPEFGFMNVRRELVQALTDAGLRWGGTDFGNQSGDIMHFHIPASEVERSR